VKANGYYLKDVIANITVGNTATDFYATYPQMKGQPCTVEVLAGNIYVNPSAVATTLNGNKLEGKSSIDIVNSKGLSIISDSTATVQVWIYG
jgi:hypothetical protein